MGSQRERLLESELKGLGVHSNPSFVKHRLSVLSGLQKQGFLLEKCAYRKPLLRSAA